MDFDLKAKEGLLSSLLEKNQLPSMEFSFSRQTLIELGLMLFITITAILILNAILKLSLARQ